MKLLVVEDDANVAAILAETFRADGHDTMVEYTGEAALAVIGRDRPDAVILDIALPQIDGIEVLRKIRSSDTALPVIIVSGAGTGRQFDEARRLGVTDIITKPAILNHFTEALTQIATTLRHRARH
jgi:two-component system OmpR family response regulator